MIHYFGGFMGDISYANKLKTQLYWWLSRRRPFVINDEYEIELLFIDKVNNSAKIQITNLKTGEVLTKEESGEVDVDF
jgi:hypothetical protein